MSVFFLETIFSKVLSFDLFVIFALLFVCPLSSKFFFPKSFLNARLERLLRKCSQKSLCPLVSNNEAMT